MLSNMEKFINFKQLNVVKQATATADGSATLKLIASGGAFFENTLVNAIVWDRTTAAADGGQKYIVTVVDSTTQLSLVALGPAGSTLGTGVPNTVVCFIYMPEYTVVYGAVTDGLQAAGTYQLIDTTVNFLNKGVKVGDTAYDITSDVVTEVLGITTTTNPYDTLTVSADTFLAGDDYIVYRAGADDHDVIMRSADVADVSNSSTTSSVVNTTYEPSGTAVMKVDYAYSSTVGANSDMRGAIQDAVTASLQTAWPAVTYDFPGLLNPAVAVTNATWLGGRDYFFLRIQ